MKLKGHLQVDGEIDALSSRIRNVAAPVDANDAARKTDLITFTDGSNVYLTPGQLNFNEADFYLSSDLGGDPVANLQPVKVRVKESESGGFDKAGTPLIFNSLHFYLTPASDNGVVISAVPGGDLLESIGLHVQAPDIDNYTLDYRAAYTYTIDGVKFEAGSGSMSGGFYINNLSVTGLDPLTFDTTASEATPSGGNTVTAGDKLFLSLFSGTADDIQITITTTRI